MSNKIRHVLGISGGKDSAALAIYLRNKHPELDIEYYFCDTGKELEATYKVVNDLEGYLGKKIARLSALDDESNHPVDAFDHYFHLFGGFLPSSNARWCTNYLKLQPFEKFVGDDLVISYVGIRGDEDREGYISKKPNIQSVFPFRKNIWSEDVISKVLKNENISSAIEIYSFYFNNNDVRFIEILQQPVSLKFNATQKLNLLLDRNTKAFNKIVFEYLKTTNYPLAQEQDYALLNNEDVLIREDVFRILGETIGVPEYYEKKDFNLNGQTGQYARSRSGCYFCFFQQKIEWIWLYEQHNGWFEKAMQYENEKEGFTWNQNESLQELILPERIEAIKKEYLNRNKTKSKSPYLLDILDDAESEGCAACFI